MKVVFDNNVLISAALLRHSIPFKAFEKAISKHDILRSHSTLEELSATLFKSKFDKYFKDEQAKESFVISFIAASLHKEITHKITICRDPKDNIYLELALAGRADFIVSGDNDLLVLNPFRNIQIITPREFIEKR